MNNKKMNRLFISSYQQKWQLQSRMFT